MTVQAHKISTEKYVIYFLYPTRIKYALFMLCRTLNALSKKLWELEVPLVLCRSYGFIGYIRLQLREHTVVEAHPDNDFHDLRLDKPFPALVTHMDSINLAELDNKDHAHVPFVVILYKHLQQWKTENEDRLPRTFKEKESLREMIREG